jgi:hypothetical protein
MPEPDAVKVSFDEAQQQKIDLLIREAQGRAASAVRAELHTTQTKLTTLLAESEVLRAENATLKEGRGALESNLSVKEKEAKSARAETIAVKKQNAIQAAATEHNFFNPQVVSKLTEDKIKWDAGKEKFIVLGDDGSERLGADGNSLSVSAFLKEFGTSNPYLVRGDVKTGVGSGEAQQPPHRTLGQKEKLAQYFGKGSSSQKANALALESPNLYRQYKREARALGIIP